MARRGLGWQRRILVGGLLAYGRFKGSPPTTPGRWEITSPSASGAPWSCIGTGSTWSQSSAPSPGHRGRYRGAHLEALHAISPTDVWAVGWDYTYSSHAASPLIERWDGTTWTTLRMPKPGPNTELSTILAASPTDVTVAGGYGDGFSDDAMFLGHWDGTAWSITYPKTPGVDGFPSAGYAASHEDQWIVGDYRTASTDKPLIGHWDGSSWRRVRGASPHYESDLGAIAGTSAADVWAVGEVADAAGSNKPLIEHWNGATWTRIPGPKPAMPIFGVASVTAIDPDDAWLVASTGTSTQRTATAARWDGTSWTWVPMP